MRRFLQLRLWIASAIVFVSVVSSHAEIIISEIHPTGVASTTPYKQDFFELTNTGAAAVDITGWKMDDNSNAFASAVPLTGVTSIPSGQSVVFLESTGSADIPTLIATFENAWFGSNVPAGFTIGTYGGSGVGLGATGDAVNIFDAAGTRVTGVSFGAATTGTTFDNAAGIGGTTLPLPVISTSSVVGTHGAFLSPADEIGSPGTIGTVPEPGGVVLLGVGLAVMAATYIRRKIGK